MSLIIDTDVLSAARRPDRAPKAAAWLAGQAEATLFLSVITLGEIERGIRLAERGDAGFAHDLMAWLDRTVTLFADRILPFTIEDARVWGTLSPWIGHPGADLMIAAQAIASDAAVATGNVADFAPTAARLVNPFDAAASLP